MERIQEMKNVEKQMADFYMSSSNKFKDTGTIKIFSTLAANTNIHYKLLNDLDTQGEKFESEKEEFDVDLFTCLDDCGCAYIKVEEIGIYVAGSDLERKIIGLYNDIKKSIKDEQILEILEYIIKKHKDALFILSDMIELLNRNSEWVESAEFTLREPY